MALDFPNAPSNGQTYTGPGGVVWTWDGTKWANGVSAASAATPSDTAPAMDGTAAAGTSALYSRGDHIHPTDTSRAPLASPVFTGDARAVTPAAGDADTSIATTAFVAASTATALVNVGRNLIHNSMFNIAQRGAGPFTTAAYTLDRWIPGASSDSFSFSQTTISDASRAQIGDEEASFQLVNINFVGNAAAGAYHYIGQKIENVRRLAGKNVTVSFYALAGAALKFGVNLYQGFGTGGSPSAIVTLPGQSVTLTTTWARYSLTFTLPSISGKTLGTNNDSSTWLNLWYSCGTTNAALSGSVGVQSGTINIWGVQLEIGSVATPLEKLDPVTQLQQCQRFYCTSSLVMSGGGIAGGPFGGWAPFPTAMRVPPPTITIASGGLTNCGALISAQATTAGFLFQGSATATAQTGINTSYTASADL